jgi:superoxide oxidase
MHSRVHKYPSLSIGLHWFMLLLLVAVFATIELRGIFPKGTAERDAMKMWHFMLGLSVFALALLRLLARMGGATPPINPTPPRWQTALAHAMHAALYLLMLAMPLLGWLILSAEAKPIPFFGLELPALIGANKELAKQIEEIHETIGNLGYLLIGAHALAGLYHHYIVRDNTLRRMSPFKS